MIPDHDDIFKVLGHGRMQSTVDFYSTNMPNADSNTLDNTWSATFTLPSSLTEIVADEEQYDFDSGNEFHNDIEITSTIERDGTGRVTNRNVSYEIKADDCLIIPFEVFDADGNMLQGQNKIPFGLSLSLVDSFVPSNEENN